MICFKVQRIYTKKYKSAFTPQMDLIPYKNILSIVSKSNDSMYQKRTSSYISICN